MIVSGAPLGAVDSYVTGATDMDPKGTNGFYMGPHEVYSEPLSEDEVFHSVYSRELPQSPQKQGCPWS